GAANPATVTVGSPEFAALRWLAQLAVNIVDFIDNDDYITAFPWFTEASGTIHWVYGTEQNRAYINEVYALRELDPPAIVGADPTPQSNVRFWVELFNPLDQADNTLSDYGAARLERADSTLAGGSYAIYRLLLCAEGTGTYLTSADNPRGSLGTPEETY